MRSAAFNNAISDELPSGNTRAKCSKVREYPSVRAAFMEKLSSLIDDPLRSRRRRLLKDDGGSYPNYIIDLPLRLTFAGLMSGLGKRDGLSRAAGRLP